MWQWLVEFWTKAGAILLPTGMQKAPTFPQGPIVF